MILTFGMLLPCKARAENWPQFRGVNASGVAEGHRLPDAWDASVGKGVRWKTPVAGLAHSSPIIWRDRVYVTTAISGEKEPELKVGLYGAGDSAKDMSEQRWMLICLDKRTGKVLWEKEGHRGVPTVARHTKATHCNSTPATDGKHIVTFFGAEGLFCFDMEGKQVWKKDLGRLEGGPLEFDTMEWGFASSPIIHDGRVIVQCDVHDQAFVAAFDVTDGREIWRAKRDEVPTWGSPSIYKEGDTTRIAVNGYKHIGGYDFATGKEIWKIVGGGDVPVPTPIFADGLIYITNAHGPMAPLYAIRPTASGDITPKEDDASPAVIWSVNRNGAYMQTPVYYEGLLYSCSDRGVLKCYDAKSGELLLEERLGKGSSGFTASPVAGDGKVYFASEDGDVYVLRAFAREAGDVYVLRAGRTFGEPRVNPMGEICMATPAISEGVIYYRTRGHVVAIGAD